MIKFILLAAALASESRAQPWFDQLLRADRLMSESRYREAESAYIMAREQAQDIEKDGLSLAIVLNHIGYYEQLRGRLREAQREYTAALAIVERKLGPASHETVAFTINLSSTHLELNHFSQAESLIRRSLQSSDELSPQDRAILLADLASVLSFERKYLDAEPLFREALTIFEREPSQEFRERMIIAFSNLANICIRRSQFADARIFSDRARALLATLTDPPPLIVLKTMANAAAVTAKTGTPDETDSLFQFALSFCEKNFGSRSYLLGQIMLNYAEFLRTVHRGAEARAASKQAKEILESFKRENLLGNTVDVRAFR